MLLLDTAILVDYVRQKAEAVAFVQKRTKAELALSPIVVMELYQGARNRLELQRIKRDLNGFFLLDLTKEVADTAVRVYETYVLSHGLSIPDAFVAATALVFDLELRTYNLKDFRFIPNLRVSDSLD